MEDIKSGIHLALGYESLLSKIVHVVSKNVTQHNFTRIHIVNRVLITSGSTHSRQNVSLNYNPLFVGKHPLIPLMKKPII